MSVALNHSFSAVHVCFTFLIVALDFVIMKYSSISYSYYWILCDVCVLYSTLQSLFIGKILVLKVLLPLTPSAFPMKKCTFLSSFKVSVDLTSFSIRGMKIYCI